MPVRILYLEDSATDASLVLTRLLRSGIPAVLDVVNTREAYAAALANPAAKPDVVMCDNAVPGYSGLNALSEARTLCPGVHVLLISGNVNPRDAERSLEAGATDFLSKAELWRLPHAIKRTLTEPVPAVPEAPSGWALLVQVVQQLSMARDMETITAIVRRAARTLTGADGATFVLREGDLCYYADEDAIAPLWKGGRFPLKACVSGWVMLNRKAVVIPDIYADPRVPVDAYRPTFVKSMAMVPIRTESPLGAIGNYWAAPHDTTPEDVALLSALADTTSVAIENVQLLNGLETRVRERTIELEAANRELEAFSFSISHDLRSPITAIKGFAEILEEDYGTRLDNDGRQLLAHVRSASDRMMRTADALLSLARLSRAQLTRETTDLSAIAQQVLARLSQQNRERDVHATIDTSLFADADPELATIVLENLLNNAWKYTSKNPKAAIHFGRTPDGVFFVRDNGVGFDMAHASGLFAPFQRLHSDREFTGTGIGLATVQRVIHRHGGQIRAESTPGEGAVFYFTLAPTI